MCVERCVKNCLFRNSHGRDRMILALCKVHLKPRELHLVSRAESTLTVTSTKYFTITLHLQRLPNITAFFFVSNRALIAVSNQSYERKIS